METITYRGFEIKEDTRNPYAQRHEVEYKFFPEGNEDDDADYEDGSYYYTGNGKWVDSIEEAKAAIDEYWLENLSASVTLKDRTALADGLHAALDFAIKTGGELKVFLKGKEFQFDNEFDLAE
jgi:hypothetical protein